MNWVKNIFIFIFLLFFFFSLAFFFPRWISSHFGELHFISSYLYIYGLGVPFFILGLWFLVHSKALNLKAVGEKKWLLFFIFGLIWNILFHGFWIFLAVQFPFKGII